MQWLGSSGLVLRQCEVISESCRMTDPYTPAHFIDTCTYFINKRDSNIDRRDELRSEEYGINYVVDDFSVQNLSVCGDYIYQARFQAQWSSQTASQDR